MDGPAGLAAALPYEVAEAVHWSPIEGGAQGLPGDRGTAAAGTGRAETLRFAPAPGWGANAPGLVVCLKPQLNHAYTLYAPPPPPPVRARQGV